jgi:D-threonate/D-erythronate kinase
VNAECPTKPAGIIVIADDLSGAAELANAALQAGFSAEVQMRFSAGSDADVVCVNTETRSLSATTAAAIVGEIARSIEVVRPVLVYKKCDSVLRGPVAAESVAIARALGRQRILLVPANPSRQRIIRGGEYFVGGTPLAETAFATDPEYPCRTSRVVELLGNPQGNSPGIETPDVVSAEDLARLAATVDAGTLPAGGVDFFSALLATRVGRVTPCAPSSTSQTPKILAGTGAHGVTRPTVDPLRGSLFVCGSHSAWLAGRNEQCAERGIQVCSMPRGLFERELREDILARWATSAASGLRERGAALLAIGGEKPVPGVTAAMLTDRLSQGVELTLQQCAAARVFLEGGSTAAAVVGQLGLERFRAQPSPGPGVGALLPVGQKSPLLLIKPGSYPWPEAVWLHSSG